MSGMAEKKLFIELCAEAGNLSQLKLSKIADLHQTTVSRVLRRLPVARRTAYQLLVALNKVRAERSLSPVQFDDVLW